MRYRRFTACLVALAILSLGGLRAPGAQAEPVTRSPAAETLDLLPGTVAVDPAVSSAVLEALRQSEPVLPPMQHAAITAVSVTQDWQLVSVAGLHDLQPDGSWRLAENGAWFGLVVVHRLPTGDWRGAVEGAPDYGDLLASVPDGLLSASARRDLAPTHTPLSASALTYRFPWQPGTKMFYGTFGVHASGFSSWVSGWKAVDFVSDGDTAAGHAPNRLLASAPGTIGAVCNDGTSVAIRMDYAGSPQLLYLHLQNNSRLRSGTTFAQGDEIGQLRTGPFNAACGWGDQGAAWFHVHYAFPAASGLLELENWTLNLTDGIWRNGNQAVSPGNWLAAGPPALPAPVLVRPTADAVEPAGFSVKLEWTPVAGATAYQIDWTGEPYTNTQPVNWFAGTSYDIGKVAPGTYNWRVRARNAVDISAWSEARSITISPVQMLQPLTMEPALPVRAETVTATFRLTNTTPQTITLRAVTVQVLDPTCPNWSCSLITDFPPATNIVLRASGVYTYTGQHAFSLAGRGYQAAPAYQDAAGVWHRPIPGAPDLTFSVTTMVTPRLYLPSLKRQASFGAG